MALSAAGQVMENGVNVAGCPLIVVYMLGWKAHCHAVCLCKLLMGLRLITLCKSSSWALDSWQLCLVYLSVQISNCTRESLRHMYNIDTLCFLFIDHLGLSVPLLYTFIYPVLFCLPFPSGDGNTWDGTSTCKPFQCTSLLSLSFWYVVSLIPSECE